MTSAGRQARTFRLAILATGLMLTGPMSGIARAQSTGDSAGADAKAASATGAQVYREICQACHMPNAEGGKGAGAIPALANNKKLADADWMVTTIIKGRGGMPAFAGMLSAAQISGVATYVRTHFGNDDAKPVTVADVKRLMPASDDSSE